MPAGGLGALEKVFCFVFCFFISFARDFESTLNNILTTQPHLQIPLSYSD